MSDEERDTYDDSSTEMKLLRTDSDERCPYCNIYKVMSESKLFGMPEALKFIYKRRPNMAKERFLHKWDNTFHHIKEGSNKGCQFCGLLVDVISAWEKEHGGDGSVFEFHWFLDLRSEQFLVRLEAYTDLNIFVSVSVFRDTGMCFINCEKPAFTERYRIQATMESL